MAAIGTFWSTHAGKELIRLAGQHKDVVTGVGFNPLFPQLATASFDGTVKFYVDPTADPTAYKGI